MTSWMRWSTAVAMLSVSGLAGAQQQGVSADEIRVGTIQDLTGPIAALGKPKSERSAEAAGRAGDEHRAAGRRGIGMRHR